MTRSRPARARARRGTNQALLVLIPLAVATGLFANTIGTEWWIHPAAVHGAVAIAVALLTPWKSAIVRRGLGRGRASRWTSIALLVLVVIALVSGLVHSLDLAGRVGPLTLMQVHIGAAIGALVLVVFHYRSHPVPIRAVDVDRRAMLGIAALGLSAAVARTTWELAMDVAGSAGAGRRFTGSHERGSFDPAAMPVTSWLDDRVQHIDAGEWTLSCAGRLLSLADVAALPQDDVTAILDCTSAWYSEQLWSGVRLDRLVDTELPSIDVTSATGYGRRFPTRDLASMWLVTHAGGAPLSPGHGFPARLVAPGRRGFWWVKWVVAIEPSAVPWWVQSPFPLT